MQEDLTKVKNIPKSFRGGGATFLKHPVLQAG